MEGLHQQVVGALAEMAVKTNDAQLKDLFAASGFSLSPSPAAGKGSKRGFSFMENEQAQNETRPAQEPEGYKPREWNLPFAITLAALLVYFGFQTVQLFAQRSELRAVKSSQEQARTAQNVS